MLLRGLARRRLVVGILGIQAAAIAVFSVVAGQWSDRAITNQMEAILDLAAKDAIADVDAYVDAMEGAASQVIAAVEQAGDNTARSEQSLFHALAYVPHLSGAYVGASDGGFLYVRTDDGGYVSKTIVPETQSSSREVVLVDRNASFAVESVTRDYADDYDPRVRPWFRDALAAQGAPIWTEPYIFFTSRQPGMTRAALIDRDGSDVVAGVDFELSVVVGFLDQLSSDINGEVTIRTPDGMLLTRDQVFDVDEVPEPHLALTRASQSDQVTELSAGRVSYDVDGVGHVRHRAAVGPANAPWELTLDLSEDDVVSPILGAFAKQRWLSVIVGSLSLLSMALVSRSPLRRLELESTTDTLTSLPNRREILRKGAAIAEHRDGYSVAMIDVDRFKLVNDTFGHPVGDEVLQVIGARLMSHGLPVGRLGGEEFLMLFKHTTPIAVDAALAQVRSSIVNEPIETSVGPISVTVSIGIHRHRAGVGFSAVLAGADLALLEAKRSGRDRVIRFSDLDTLHLAPDEERRQQLLPH